MLGYEQFYVLILLSFFHKRKNQAEPILALLKRFYVGMVKLFQYILYIQQYGSVWKWSLAFFIGRNLYIFNPVHNGTGHCRSDCPASTAGISVCVCVCVCVRVSASEEML